jgi:hypothetical protein
MHPLTVPLQDPVSVKISAMQGAQGATLTMVMAWRPAAEGNKQQTCERALPLPEIRAFDPLRSPILPSFMKRQMTGCCYIPLCQVRGFKNPTCPWQDGESGGAYAA